MRSGYVNELIRMNPFDDRVSLSACLIFIFDEDYLIYLVSGGLKSVLTNEFISPLKKHTKLLKSTFPIYETFIILKFNW